MAQNAAAAHRSGSSRGEIRPDQNALSPRIPQSPVCRDRRGNDYSRRRACVPLHCCTSPRYLAHSKMATADGSTGRGTANTLPLPLAMQWPTALYRLEADVRDCQVEGQVPADLNGAFYRVGPDAQYPLHPRNIPFDGEGHVSMFRIRNGRVDYRSRYVRNERYLAQYAAGRTLFPIYRNPFQDDPSVIGLSRSTANTHIINHRKLLLALKEDSPPSALDLLTLDTVVPNYTFDGTLPSKTFTAHPKRDPVSGNLVAFGYEAEGFGSSVVSMFEISAQGKVVWNAKVQVPYVGMLHDFA